MTSAATNLSPTEDLRSYLSHIPPATRAMLLHELEYGSLAGKLTIGLDRVLDELRVQQRESGLPLDRIEGPARRFFYPLEPFLIDEELSHKLPGRIHRSSLLPIWNLLSRVALPRESESFSRDLGCALASEDNVAAAAVTARFRSHAIQVIDQTVAVAENDDAARARMIEHFGSERVIDDLVDVVTILREERTLSSLATYLPRQIQDLTDCDLKNLKSLFTQPVLSRPDMLPYALALVLSRLASPVQLLRFVPRVGENVRGRPEKSSPFVFAIDLVLGEVSRIVFRLESDLRTRRNKAAVAGIKKFQELLRELNGAIELPLDTSWAQRLNFMRTDIAVLIRSKIETLPGRVLRVLRLRATHEIESGAVIDAEEVADIEASLQLLSACRELAGEIALKEVIERLDEELESCLMTATPYLLMSVSQSDPRRRPFLLSQIDAAVRFSGQRSGKRYAELLAGAAIAAAQTEAVVH